MSRLRLAVFDVDGTLVDSQADIVASMEAAYAAVDAEAPSRTRILGIVGLSLPQAIAALAPEQSSPTHATMVEAYKDHYAAQRRAGGPSPLYPGMRDLLDRCARIDSLLLAVATGKSRRGLDALLETLELDRYFVSTHCADDHPSKPDPSMLHAVLRDAGVEATDAVMIGDTRFDIDMARAAGMPVIGVSWGYHDRADLAGAARVVDDAEALAAAVSQSLEITI